MISEQGLEGVSLRVDFSETKPTANLWYLFRFSHIKRHQAGSRITKVGASHPQKSPVQLLFLSVTGVPKALPCPRQSQPQGLSARTQLIAHLLSRLPAGLPTTAWSNKPASMHLTSSSAPNCPIQLTITQPLSEELITGLLVVCFGTTNCRLNPMTSLT